MINDLIMSIFKNFTVGGKKIPVKYMYYQGHGEPFVTFMKTDADNSFSGDDELMGYVDYYDFDIYGKGNFEAIIENVKQKLKDNDFMWQPSRDSSDLYEVETGYYHRTLCFAIPREE